RDSPPALPVPVPVPVPVPDLGVRGRPRAVGSPDRERERERERERRHRARALLGPCPVSITPPIRHRLLTVVFLGVITSGLSLVALVRLLSTTTQQRVERARDNVGDEVEFLAAQQ